MKDNNNRLMVIVIVDHLKWPLVYDLAFENSLECLIAKKDCIFGRKK